MKQHTSGQVLDFYHASEYLAGAAEALFPTSKAKRKRWLEDRLHCLKHKCGAAKKILHEIESAELPKRTTAFAENRYKAVTYVTNNYQLMNYHQALKRHWPIGSGVGLQDIGQTKAVLLRHAMESNGSRSASEYKITYSE